jgi:hypothetical protein
MCNIIPRFANLNGCAINQPNGSKHLTRSQKGHQMLNIISQNQVFIYLLPFTTIIIMASQSFSPHMNVKELRVKIHLIQF